MGKYAGYIVENSQEGILDGMFDFIDSKVICQNSDFEKYNQEAIGEFLELLNK